MKILRFTQNDIILVPIPLSLARFKKRGYNQAEILAKTLAKKFGFEVWNCLARTRETRTQVGLTKEKRKENVKGAFMLNTKYQIQNNNLILVDDVLTTGSTFSEAGSILKRNGAAKVWAVAFAREQ